MPRLLLLSLLCLAMYAAAEPPPDRFARGLHLLERLRDYPAAAACFEEVSQDPAADRLLQARALYRLAQCQQEQGKAEAALATMTRLLDGYADQTEALRQLLDPDAKGRPRLQREAATSLARERLEQRLDLLVLPQVELKDLPVAQAFLAIRDLSRLADPGGQGIDVAVVTSPATVRQAGTQPAPRRDGDDGEDAAPAPPPAAPEAEDGFKLEDQEVAAPETDAPAAPAAAPDRLSLSLRDVPVRSALELVARISGWRLHVAEQAVVAGPPEVALEPLESRVHPVTGEFVTAVREAVAQWHLEDAYFDRSEFELFFQRIGIPWSTDSAAIVDGRNGLRVVATPTAHAQIARLLSRLSPGPAQVAIDVRLVEFLDAAAIDRNPGRRFSGELLSAAQPDTLREISRFSVITTSGTTAEVKAIANLAGAQAGQGPRLQVTPTVAGDVYTIDLRIDFSCHLPGPDARFIRHDLQTHILIRDGSAIAWQLGQIEGHPVAMVLTATLLDRAGRPLPRD